MARAVSGWSPGDHHRGDAGRHALGDRGGGLLPRRVDEPHQPQQHQVRLDIVHGVAGRQALPASRRPSPGPAGLRQPCAPACASTAGTSMGASSPRAGDARAPDHHGLRRPFRERHVAAGVAVHRRHPLAVRVERQLHDARHGGRDRGLGESRVARRDVQGGFRGVALRLAIGALGSVVAERHRAHEPRPRLGFRDADPPHRAPGPPDHSRSTRIRFCVSVPVLSEQMTVTDPSASTAGSRRTRALRRAIFPAPIASATVTTAGSASGMAATARLTAVRNMSTTGSPRSSPATKTMAQIAERRDREPLAEVREAALQRRLALGRRLDERRDAAQFGRHARGHDDAATAPVGDHRALVGHVGAVAQRGIAGPERQHLLVHGEGLAGQRGLLHLEARGLDEAQVGGHDVPGLQQHQVAGHQVARRDVQDLSFAQDARVRRAQAAKRRHGAFGAVLLDEPDDGVQDHDDHDGDGVLRLAHRAGDHRGRQEHQDHEVGELPGEHQPGRAALAFGELVRSVLREAPPRLAASRAPRRVPCRGATPPARRRAGASREPAPGLGTRVHRSALQKPNPRSTTR